MRKHEPVSDDQMLWVSPNNSICQVLRDIYHSTEDEEIRLKCRVATAMAKSMTAKLEDYKKNWAEHFWDKNKEFYEKYKEMESIVHDH